MIKRWSIRVFLLTAAFFMNFSGVTSPLIAAPSSQAPHAFPISESELRDLAQALASKVDLFRAVWEKDPEAEFFAGTTRDYLYWILGHFKGLEILGALDAPGATDAKTKQQRITEIKQKLLSLPFIKFNEIVGPESDADIMTKDQNNLIGLRAEDFAIRKLDFISFDRALPDKAMYRDEINQGYIPSEKIRLSKKGISTDPNFGNGVSDLVTGILSIQFPDLKKFWKTHYAKQGSNHPLLLALRYVRILAQDYLQRHGSEIPDAQKLEAPMTKQIKEKIKSLIQDAITDTNGSFKKLLQNEQGKKWLNASIQKSFRSFTNANAAFELMKELGILGLIEVYPAEIESVHQYLLKSNRDETKIAENFKKFGVTPDELYEKLEDYLPDRELYHGTASELAFRNIIYQGVIPSEGGSAGRGLYGVSKDDLEFAKSWSKRKSRQDDLVIALRIKFSTKIVDITKGKGKELFEQWLAQQRKDSERPEDAFAEAFGIDLLRYPYNNTEAFVLKNADQILSRRGVFKNPRPLSELLSEAVIAREKNDLYFLKDFFETPLTKDERSKILYLLGAPYFTTILSENSINDLKMVLNLQIIALFEFVLHSSLTSTYQLVWNLIPALLKDPDKNIRWTMVSAIAHQTTWPSSFWDLVPVLMKDRSENVRWGMFNALQNRSAWPASFWNEVPALMKDPNEVVREHMGRALQTKSFWPASFWNEVVNLMKDPNLIVQRNMIFTLQNQSAWTQEVIDSVPRTTDPVILQITGRKRLVLDLSACEKNLSEVPENHSLRNPLKEAIK